MPLSKFREGSCSLLEIEIERTICEVSSGNLYAMCLLLEITIIFRDSDIQFFWRRFAQWKLS